MDYEMSSEEFVDYYEVLEISRNASPETIERVFRYFAKQYHPDVAQKSDVQQFSLIVEAYETLKDAESRAAYDEAYKQFEKGNTELLENASSTRNDTAERHHLLSLFYAQRRRDMKQPGLGVATLEQIVDSPENVVNFHLWYFREKGWIKREESGLLSITAQGVDQIEARELQLTRTIDKRIELKSDRREQELSTST